MGTKVDCPIHGEQDETFVCSHIIQTLRDNIPRGFTWVIDDENSFQAFCDECTALDDEAFNTVAAEIITLLCLGCFRKAAEINKVNLTPQ